MRRISFKVLIAVGLLLVLGGCGVQQVQPKGPAPVPTVAVPTPTPSPTYSVQGGSIAATVNGQPIPMKRFRAFFNFFVQASQQQGSSVTPQAAAKQALSQLVEYQIIAQQAEQRHLTAPASDVSRKLAADVKQAGGKAAFQAALRQHFFTLAMATYSTRIGILQAKLVAAAIPETKSGAIATGRHILIGAREPKPAGLFASAPPAASKDRCEKRILTDAEAHAEAEKLRSQIEAGASFATLARRCSDDASSAHNGGALVGTSGSRTLYPYVDGFVAPFEAALFQGPVQKLQLVHSVFGWHIVQVTTRRTGAYPAALRAQIQQAHFTAWISQLAQSAKVTILEKVS